MADDGDRAEPPVEPSEPPDPEPAGKRELTAADGTEPSRDVTLCYDVGELTRCLTFSFSAGELSKYAERWKVFTDREGTVAEGARTLVRAMDGRGKLPQLVTSLRAHKPLVEWPEPTVVAAPPKPEDAAPEQAETQEAAPAAAPAAAGETAAAEAAAPATSGAPLVDPFSAAEGSGTAPDEGLWARLDGPTRAVALAVIFAAGIGLGVLGFWLLRSGGNPPETASPAAEETSLAGVAATLLRSSVAGIVQACEVTEETDTARNALTMAFRRCAQPEIRPGLPPGPLPLKARKPAAEPPPRATPRRPVSHEPVCLDRCHRLHEQCKTSECGSEPSSSSKYADYQRCLGGCLSKYSRCRLSCP